MKLLIKNAKIIPMTKQEILSSDIYIEDGIIKEIEKNIDRESDQVIDASNAVVMPGLINCHTHVAMSLFRNYADDYDLNTWLTQKIWPLESKLNADDVYYASLLSAIEMVKTGTTTFADMYFLENETYKAITKLSLRAQLATGLTDFNGEGYETLDIAEDFFENYNDKNEVYAAFGPHAVYTTNEVYLREISKRAKEKNIPMHIHLSETKKENEDAKRDFNKTPTQIMNDCGIFDQKTIAAHGVYLEDVDLDILRNKDVSIVHCPSSNLKLASGFLDVKRLMDNNINVCLGTDSSASNNHLSLLKEMNLTALVSKKDDPTNLKAYDVLKMATINGAKALGIDDRIGSVEVGKEADLIIIDINNVNHVPYNNLISSICYSTYENDIRDVIIKGEIVYRDRKFLKINEDEVIKEANERFEKLRNR
ncbi:MAG: amidohydrolase [Tissierellia bacterium]|nr:amidohydrolase [Tissierellia bacterium]